MSTNPDAPDGLRADPPMPSPDAVAFVVFGVTGDLATRKLMPALWALHTQGSLHPDTRLVGYARSEGDDQALRVRMRDALERYVGPVDEDAWRDFGARIHAVRGGYDDPEGHRALGARLGQLGLPRRLFYTATPPSTYAGIADAMAEAGLNRAPEGGWARLVIEKPFGWDEDSARELNARLRASFDEAQIYRIDHYLAKETAQNLAVLRFANTLFEPVWSNRFVDHVQITMAEPMGVEGRGAFYDEAGVVRDVFQNHLLQLLALVAMEPPARWEADAVRDEKVKVLRAMACPHADRAVFGQYVASGAMPGYQDEDGVAPDSTQATYAAVQFDVHTWRWSGVPFYVRSGKRLADKASEIVLHFKTPPHVPFELGGPLAADRLVLRVTPNEGIRLHFNAKLPGQGIRLGRVSLDFAYERRFERPSPDAYETLLLDAMLGDATLFMRSDEVEAQWRVVTPLLECADGGAAPQPYPAGGRGPDAADRLLAREGRRWHPPGDPADGTGG
ncbi:MAG: glucose-6-phosphate dehydrogenase [Trueperaceae bacterium]|nr:glucose-6-phosphate dehydrogenase [Trueperaceae bacterium]